MLIAIAGAQGCGKSTTIEQLTAKGFGVIERKTSRSILSDWNKSLDDINNDIELSKLFQNEILSRKMSDEAEASQSDDIVFTERTYMDLFVYALINIGKFNEHSDWLNDYYIRCCNAQSSYKHVFYLLSGHFDVVADGVRGNNRHYSTLVDLTLKHYTTQQWSKVPTTIIDTPSLQDRVDMITQYATK